jgi:arabinogalactan oligomer/maltooligosaccharide transport system substrate-binding protein
LGLYYNQEMLDEPPMHIEAIRELVANGVSLSAPIDAYYLYGTFGMVGATVLDDAGRCVADRTGGERALIELLELQELGAILENESEFVEGLFLDRAVGMNLNGPWVLQMYREVLGDQLRLAPLPESDAGRFIPLLSVDGYMVNPNSEHLDQAIEVVKFLAGREAAQIYSEVAWKVPVRWDVEPPDPLLRNFTELMEFDDLSMRRPEFGNYWDPFGGMFFDVLKNRVDPGLALQEACARMNELNGK